MVFSWESQLLTFTSMLLPGSALKDSDLIVIILRILEMQTLTTTHDPWAIKSETAL